jgi:AcrR family transcriptional regulator
MEAGIKAITGTGPRERLLIAAVRLFARKGYAATSVREIVEGAGVTKPALYYYFGNKEGVFLAMMEEAVRVNRAALEEVRRERGSATERILILCEREYALVLDNAEAVRAIDSFYYGPAEGAPRFDFQQLYGEFDVLLRELVEEAVASGELVAGRVDDQVIALTGGFLAGKVSVSGRCLQGDARRPEDLRRIIEIILNGMRARPAGRPEVQS